MTAGRMGIDKEITNKESDLRREWIFLDDPRLPIGFDLSKTKGIRTGKKFNGHTFDWLFETTTVLQVRDTPITALEVRHLTFDVWGEHVRTLTGTEIADRQPSEAITLEHTWNLYSDNEAWSFYASISFVAQVRTLEGRVIKAETDAVLREAQRFSEKFSVEQLEPTPKKP